MFLKRISKPSFTRMAILLLILTFLTIVKPIEGGEFRNIFNSVPNINIWYGLQQSSGQIGTPQKWVNILGNTSDPDGLSSLEYSLNGGSSISLSVGPDARRLESAGDFNIDIDRADLSIGPNQVVITSTDSLSNVATETVQVNYASGNVWPKPYSIDWSAVSNIQDVAHVVDGKWSVSSNGVKTDIPGYDRLIAIGDVTWDDYEVKVPITIHSVDYGGNSSPGVGILMRWQGHTNNPIECNQPQCGWKPYGGIGWWRFSKFADDKLEFHETSESQTFNPVFNTKYWFKIRVETQPNGDSRYRLRAWKVVDPEPSTWNLDVQESPEDRKTGSFLLLAHHVDATFGDVQVAPIGSDPTYSLTVSKVGNGTVNPPGGTYAEGTVVTLTANAGTGWTFSNWSGDVTSTSNPVQITMDGNKSVTANFTQDEYTLSVNTVGDGTVSKNPEQATYLYDDVVTLTATADQGWTFSNWSGDITSTSNPVQITMDSNKTVTANFAELPPDQYTLTVTEVGNGTVLLNPLGGTYSEGTVVTLTANADIGWTFSNWSGDVTGASNPVQITMDSNKSIIAEFNYSVYIPMAIGP